MITLDTSAVIAMFARRDPDHRRVSAALRSERSPYLLPAATLGEVAHFVESSRHRGALDALLADLEQGSISLDCGEEDLPRVRELVGRYADLPLGLVDAAVIACAERNGGRVLTLDLRHFGVGAREGALTVLP